MPETISHLSAVKNQTLSDNGLIQRESCYQFKNLFYPEYVAFFSRRKADLSFTCGAPEQVKQNRQAFLEPLGIDYGQLVCCQQPHAAEVFLAKAGDKGKGADSRDTAVPDCDALVTDCRGLALAVFSADCLPVFFYAPDVKVAGIAHAGWRSTKQGIVRNAISTMAKEFNVDSSKLIVGLGPALRSCCYEVKEEFRGFFPSAVFARGDKWYLDLIKANREQLKEMHVNDRQIVDSGFCTCCMSGEFFSFRREGNSAGRMMSLVMLK